MRPARQLVERWRHGPCAAIPAGAQDAALVHLFDMIDVGVAAAATSTGRPYRRAAHALNGSGGPATIFGLADDPAPPVAALVSGGMIHALEYNDTHADAIEHGRPVLTSDGVSTSGAAPLPAPIKGSEVLIRMASAAPGRFQAHGFQIASVGRTLAAALVAADPMRPDTATTVGEKASRARGVRRVRGSHEW
jgi:2-methylcitrate dehydratase PrpD